MGGVDAFSGSDAEWTQLDVERRCANAEAELARLRQRLDRASRGRLPAVGTRLSDALLAEADALPQPRRPAPGSGPAGRAEGQAAGHAAFVSGLRGRAANLRATPG